MSLSIGTSGWWYDEWVGPFYKRKKGMFTRYAEVFSTTEINSTFYRYPSSSMVRGWYRSAPPGFIFAAKLPRIITHEKWLRLEEGVGEDTARFLNLMQPLAEKLGPILIQLRPKFSYGEHTETLERYLETLPENYEWAVEFRNSSWLRPETWRLLRRYGVAYTIVDEPLLPPDVHVTAKFAYIRWHGHGANPWYNYDYKPEELEAWAPKVKEATDSAERVYGYFNNHFSANAVKNAVEMLTLLDSSSPEQNAALKEIIDHRKKPPRSRGIRRLEDFAGEEEDLSVADLLMRFTTTSRLKRAEGIENEELTINRDQGGLIEASIKDYRIKIDLNGRVLRHNCEDWRKGAEAKRMCKHAAKLFLSLPGRKAKEILESIWEEKENWRFEAA